MIIRPPKATKRTISLSPEFIRDYPALKLGNWLVAADLHLGITREMYEAGVSLPSQVRAFVKRLRELQKKTKTSKLILLGDVKHKVPGISRQEGQELPEFLEKLEFEEIVIVKGNHDAEIETMIPVQLKPKVKIKSGLSIGDYHFTHGHRHVKTKAKTIVIGHNQPAILFQDDFGVRYLEPAWVRGPLRGPYRGHELIIVPAFNELRGHALVNRNKLIGPIAKSLNTKAAHAFLLDGTDLGTLVSLKLKDE